MDPKHLLLLLFAFLVTHEAVVGSEVNVIASEGNMTLSEEHNFNVTEVTVTDDYEESEEEENEELGDTTEDVARVQSVVKPTNSKNEAEKKISDKKKKRKGKGKKKNRKEKKENPCETTHQGFCIHGECVYLEHLEKVSCRCQLHYFGERCSELSLGTRKDLSDVSMTALIVIAVLLSAISFIAIIIIIVVHTHKKYSSGYEGEVEEKKKLGQENGSGELDV